MVLGLTVANVLYALSRTLHYAWRTALMVETDMAENITRSVDPAAAAVAGGSTAATAGTNTAVTTATAARDDATTLGSMLVHTFYVYPEVVIALCISVLMCAACALHLMWQYRPRTKFGIILVVFSLVAFSLLTLSVTYGWLDAVGA